jgi:hypothetical protein
MANNRSLVFTSAGITEEAKDSDTQIVSNTVKNNSGSFTINASSTSLILQVAGSTLVSVAAAGVQVGANILPTDDEVYSLGDSGHRFTNVWADEVDAAIYSAGTQPMGFNANNVASTTSQAFSFTTGSGNVALISNKGFVAQQAGGDLASASTISPTNAIHRVTGTAAINTITPPDVFNDGDNTGGHFTAIPTGIFTWTASGNIAVSGTAVVGKAIIFTWMPGLHKWYPSSTS